jgi:hypothetical protein
MDFSSINWLAVLVSAIASMVIGSVWFHPSVFFTTWWNVVGGGKPLGEEDMPSGAEMAQTYGLTFLASFVMAAVVSLLLNALGANDLTSGVTMAFWLWLGLLAPTFLHNKLFAGHGLKIWAIETGNHLVTLLAYGAILGAWQ